MISKQLCRAGLLALVCSATVMVCNSSATAQTASQSAPASSNVQAQDDINVELQLHLILATNQGTLNEKIPASLEPVIKQLRQSLPFKNYSLLTTVLSRVKDGGRVDSKWIGGALLAPGSSSASTPGFNDLAVRLVKLMTDGSGREVVLLNEFRFGARVPIQTGQARTTDGSASASVPLISYEPIGLQTEISMREGEPVVVGTLNVGPFRDAIVVVVSANRAPK